MAKKVAAPVEDEVEEIEEVEEAPANSKKAAPAEEAEDEVWGVRSLIDYIEEKTGKKYNPREVRTLLRKLAREGGGVNREIVAGNKSRYSWDGPGDPEVKAILKAVKAGGIEEGKKAALDKLKQDKAKKTAAAPAKAKKAAAPVADDEDEDDDE